MSQNSERKSAEQMKKQHLPAHPGHQPQTVSCHARCLAGKNQEPPPSDSTARSARHCLCCCLLRARVRLSFPRTGTGQRAPVAQATACCSDAGKFRGCAQRAARGTAGVLHLAANRGRRSNQAPACVGVFRGSGVWCSVLYSRSLDRQHWVGSLSPRHAPSDGPSAGYAGTGTGAIGGADMSPPCSLTQ